MTNQVDLYNSTYGNFEEHVMAEIRQEAYGKDIGQNSWITADEYDQFYTWLNLAPRAHVLEVASGSGGPSLYLAHKFGCQITGIDINQNGVDAANKSAKAAEAANVSYRLADAEKKLPFEDESFDAIMCMDSMNHFHDRLAIFREWQRVLRPGGRIVFTDPVVITGPVSNVELAERSAIGFFIFMPVGWTVNYLKQAGFHLIKREDVTANIELTSSRRYAARAKHSEALIKIEGQELFEASQKFADTVHKLASERRLSRIVFLAGK